jgi:hypothetical protein
MAMSPTLQKWLKLHQTGSMGYFHFDVDWVDKQSKSVVPLDNTGPHPNRPQITPACLSLTHAGSLTSLEEAEKG